MTFPSIYLLQTVSELALLRKSRAKVQLFSYIHAFYRKKKQKKEKPTPPYARNDGLIAG